METCLLLQTTKSNGQLKLIFGVNGILKVRLKKKSD